MARRSDHSRDEIREMVLSASAKIIESQGFQGLTARKLASEIGYTVGTLYLVFKNLEDIIVNVNTRTVNELKQFLRDSGEAASGPESQLRAIARAYIQYAIDHQNTWRSVFEHSLPPDQQVPQEMLEATEAIFGQVADYLKPIVSDRPDEALAEYATAIWSGVHGICILALTGKLEIGSTRSLFELADILITNFITGLITG